MPLFWRVFLANATILVAGILVLAFAPVGLGAHASLPEIVDLLVALTAMIAVNWLIVRPLFLPLERLAGRMQEADVLAGGQRIEVTRPGEVGALERSFNTMMARLEKERRQSGARQLHAQERERERIARGLHDEVGQTMTGVLFQLKRLGQDATPAQRVVLAEAKKTVRAGLEEVRRIAQELRPETLEHLGLARALASLARGFSDRTGIPVRTALAPGLPLLDPETEVVVYRVAQEALTNAARHSGAREIVLSLEHDAESVVLRVVDDGVGFEGAMREGGGLRGIRERALIVGGAAAIKPGPDGGAEVRLQVPAGKVE
ncbi:MAG TPA: sensor histidine kinase [Gaiellaceae bacterium]|jgi:two-component system sensor histidine kinase UhpB